MSQLNIRGRVSLEGGEFPVAGVTVIATMREVGVPGAKDTSRDTTVPLGRAVTDSDGAFAIETDQDDPRLSRWVCMIRHCGDYKFQVACFDHDETLLRETKPLSYIDGMPIQIALREPRAEPSPEDWKELGRIMEHSQTMRLGDIATELTGLSPHGLFRHWSVQRRLAVLARLEQALLDPRNEFAQAGARLRFWRLGNDAELLSLREQFRRQERPDLLETLDLAVERARKIGGWAEIEAPGAADLFKHGDYLAGVNHYIEHPGLFPGIVGGLESATIGYRDYLRDRWVNNQRFQHMLGEGDQEVATAATLIQRLNNRFHQDFATQDLTDQPANRVLVRILLKMLPAPTGTGYGFGIAPAAIEEQEARSDWEYLDYLISLTGLERDELQKRYRLKLDRSDLERSNPVQQNIDTLQRFFTDSYQSVDDPFAIKPDRIANTEERLIIKFPREAAGPFFLEYEEWLAREEPFYPENHYDPRATYFWSTDDRPSEKVREAVFANSISAADFLNQTPKTKYIPGGSNHVAVKWQWVRNHLELQDLIASAHNDAKSLNYVAAEQKYAQAKDWAGKMREFIASDWDAYARKYVHWDYSPSGIAKEQKNADVSTMDKLRQYEGRYHLYLGWHYGVIPEYGDLLRDGTGKATEITAKWWGDRPDLFPGPGHRSTVAYLLDYLYFRLLPACLSEVQLALGKYADAVRQLVGRDHVYRQDYWWFPGPAGFNIFAAALDAEPFKGMANAGAFRHFASGPLPYASASDRTQYPLWDDPWLFPEIPPTSVPTNRAELGWFKLKLGNAALEWADVLYRSNQPENIMRARELYKAVIFLHGDDPEITPTWDRLGAFMPPFPWKKSKRNPAVVGQVSRARLGFMQINAGLNYYGVSPTHVPPVRYRVLKEAADRFAAGARGAQTDFLNYMQQLDQLTVAEMQARTMVAKANAAISIAQEQQKIAEFNVGEVQKQVDAINAQIAAKKAEIAKKDEFFEQVKDFAGGMKDSVMNLGELAFKGEGAPAAASATQLSTGDILSLGWKVGTASNVLGAGTQALGGAAGVAGPFGAFLYAGVSSMTSMADAIAKRAGELAQLEKVALPAAKALVELKKRDVTIAQLSQAIAKADWQLGNDLLKFYAQRLLNRAFLVSMAEFSNRLMRRYLDLAGRMAWMAERALAFEQDRELGIIAFDYFPRNLKGVSGADLLQLHLAELEAARIQGLTQTIPVKQTISLARDFPVQFGQLKKTGACTFATSETPLRLVHPGVFGYRVRNITIAPMYAAAIRPHRGLISNQGVSLVTRDKAGPAHTLVRYPDALPLSEFRMRDDMWVFDLPDETLLPFEGSGFETVWELMLSKIGNANGFDALSDMLITFDMRASYSAFLEKEHIAAFPNSANRSLLVSANANNPGALAKFRKQGGKVTLAFDLAKAARNTNETARKALNFVLIAVGAEDAAFNATFSAKTPATTATIQFEKGIALSNAGALADGNGGVPLPLNAFAGLKVDQVFKLEIDAVANPGSSFKNLREVMLLAEYEATF
jgi:hypothetical protein